MVTCPIEISVFFFSGDLISELHARQGGRCYGKIDGTCFAAGHQLVLCGSLFQSQPQRVPGSRADGYKEVFVYI